MVSLPELNPHNWPTTPEIEMNLFTLWSRINIVRTAWGRPMIVTSGLRSEEQQQDLIAQGLSTATKSKHLLGEAVDILDIDGSLKAWCKLNGSNILVRSRLWCEDGTNGWVHFQTQCPSSGRLWFKP